MTDEDMKERFIFQHDLWYQRAELTEQRQGDCQRLIHALRAMQQKKTTFGSGNSNNNKGSVVVDSGDTADNDNHHDIESFCFRGLEIVLHKKQRDEVKRRAAQTVFLEQRRANKLFVANVNSAAVVKYFPHKAPASPQQVREKRAEGDSSSSDDESDSEHSDDVEDIHGSRECDFWFKHLVRLEERIADQYRLATMTCRDEAYLRGLKDAQDARKIFLEATEPAKEGVLKPHGT